MEEIRRSQLITTYGIGAISDLKDFSGVLKSPDVWDPLLINRLKKEEKIEDARLAKALNVDYFLMPPRKQEKNSGWLPFTLFPRMLYCPRCKTLQDINNWFPDGIPQYANNGDYKPWALFCTCGGTRNGKKVRTKLIPSRFIVICPKGHLDDFPYYDWVHGYKECTSNSQKHKFKLRTSGGGASLSDIRITCENCKNSKTMAGALDSDFHQKLAELNKNNTSCRGNRPELHSVFPHLENCGMDLRHLRFVLRNASSIQFPKIYSSLLIPPYSTKIYEEFLYNSLFDEYREAIRFGNSEIEEIKQDLFRWAKRKLQLNETEINNILNSLLELENEYDTEIYKNEEFRAFKNFDQIEESKNFVIKRKDSSSLKDYKVSDLLKCERLREIRVFLGFSRIRPYDLDFNNMEISVEENENDASRPIINLIRACNNDINWLPGVEYFGEGIFIVFNPPDVFFHKDKINSRTRTLNQNIKIFNSESGFNLQPINANFLALHTLSHLIIKRISFESGYPLASLKERIYCNIKHKDLNMNAILIYIADTDSVGTLGGLSRLAEQNKLAEIFEDIFEDSEWCSSDPVCRESLGQGMGSLNLAACHACCLLPETCCEYGNRFLDRTLMELYFNK